MTCGRRSKHPYCPQCRKLMLWHREGARQGWYCWNCGHWADNFPRRRSAIPAKLYREVLQRDGHRCVYCGASDGLTVDHIWPQARGGTAKLSNLQTLCSRCNAAKSDKRQLPFAEGDECPMCGGTLVRRKGRYGEFLGCNQYPECRFTIGREALNP